MVILETAYKSSLQEIEKWRGKMNKYKKTIARCLQLAWY
jgi:hypothetical protein